MVQTIDRIQDRRLVHSGISFSPTGSFSQEKPGVACAQADESYFMGRQRQADSLPDLSIEVVFTSGNESKLNRYLALEVPEVWFWEDGVFALYHLRAEGYEKISHSEVLPSLDLSLVSRCLLMASSIEAIQTFTHAIAES